MRLLALEPMIICFFIMVRTPSVLTSIYSALIFIFYPPKVVMIDRAPLSSASYVLIFVAYSHIHIAYSHSRREANISQICFSGFVLDGNPFDVAGIFDSYEVHDS